MKQIKERVIVLFECLLKLGRKLVRIEESIPSALKVSALIALLLSSLAAAIWYANNGHPLVMLEPRGVIGYEQRKLMFTALLMSLVVVVPVYAMALFFYRRFRAENDKTSYKPNWHGSRWLETIWWGVPIALILVLSVLTWQSSHKLDPFRPIDGTKKKLTIEVIALPWKWLFMYPGQHIATVNEAYIPIDTDVDFKITADAPMSSFWIPQLGGQIYAMSGMTTHLHEVATSEGVFDGANANIAGAGHSGMNFKIHAVSGTAFSEWATRVQKSPDSLDHEAYHELLEPSENVKPVGYRLLEDDLFDHVVMGYMSPFAEGGAH